jgi:RND family efflux transporter MFP subunit
MRFVTILLLSAMLFPGGSRQAPASRAVELEGLIEPYVTIDLSPAVDGLLETVEVDRGDLVEAGQVIARLESSVEILSGEIARLRAERESRIKAAEERLNLARKTLERNEDLFREKIVSMVAIDEARAAESFAAAELVAAQDERVVAVVEQRRAEAALALRTVKSPISGVVLERYLAPGELVNRTNQLRIVRIAQLDPLRVEVLAPKDMLNEVAVGSLAKIHTEAPLNETHEARVTVVDRVVDPKSGLFGIRLELPNPEYRIPAGLRCLVRFARE